MDSPHEGDAGVGDENEEPNSVVASGDVVFVKLIDTEMYLCEVPLGETYCATAGPRPVPLLFSVDEYLGKETQVGVTSGTKAIRLKYQGPRHSYLQSDNNQKNHWVYLYNATTSNGKYMYDDRYNCKQFFLVGGGTTCRYGVRCRLQDIYTGAVFCYNSKWKVDPSSYPQGQGKCWTGAYYEKNVEFADIVFERVGVPPAKLEWIPGAAQKQTLLLGRRGIAPPAPVVYHWALKVGDTWFEVDGAGKSGTGQPISVIRSKGIESSFGARPSSGGIVGSTVKSDSEIDFFINSWLVKHPTYDWRLSNCQTFVTDFAMWLSEGSARLPSMEAGFGENRTGPSAFAGTVPGEATAGAWVGHVETQLGVFRTSASGPSALASALCGSTGFGALANASVGRAEVAVAGVGLHADLNIATGVGLQHGRLVLRLLGFGLTAGHGGASIETPVGGATCIVQ